MPEHDARIAAVLAGIDRFRGATADVRRLTGGLTNTNYRVTGGDDDVVIRVSSPDSSLLAIDRDNEEHNARAAAETGVAPAVHERLLDPIALVVDYVPSRTMSAAELRRGDHLGRIATTLRVLHAGRPFRDRFDMFEICDRYLRIATDRELRLPDGYVGHRATIGRIAAAMTTEPEPLVPCNNDLLAENLLDDGERIWVIDFEYSGNNEASFELGNLASESQLSGDQLDELVAAYWGERRPDKSARAELWGLVAKYGWTLWGVISGSINDLDHDFWSFAMERYEPFEAMVRSPRLDHLLERCAAGPPT